MGKEVVRLAKYGGLYSVSSEGYVISNRTGKPLKMYSSCGGAVVRLLGIRESVPELVTETFKPRPGENYNLRYIDSDFMNNGIDNLEWYTTEISEEIKQWRKEWQIRNLREKGLKRSAKFQKSVIVLRKYPYGFERIAKEIGVSNTSRKYGVHRIEIYLSSKCGKLLKNQYRFIVQG